ncbi:hypothetical protein ACFQ88_21510 [Paenibacillus sp. NPDC056579]|uniref:hypothetical protein n=1 Tax=Paenibacillus sp. NPDC056579 TaxID=3345871 RepID=UPI0036751326
MASLLRWYNVLSFAAVLVVNALAQIKPLKGLTTGEISALFPVQITPAPYAFSIWGLIYALLIGFVIVQLLPAKSEKNEVRAIGPWFVASCFFNISWLLLWQSLSIASSMFSMLGLLIALIGIYSNTRHAGWSSDAAVRWLVQVPFSLYIGWISVAALVNLAVVLYANDWNGFGLPETLWTVILILAASLVSLWIGYRYRDPFYMLVTVWALVAIGIANPGTPPIVFISWGAAGMLFLYALLLLYSGELLRLQRQSNPT